MYVSAVSLLSITIPGVTLTPYHYLLWAHPLPPLCVRLYVPVIIPSTILSDPFTTLPDVLIRYLRHEFLLLDIRTG